MYQYKFSDIEAQLQCALQWPHFIPPLSPTYLHMYIDPFLHLQMSYRNDTFWSEKIRLESGRLCSSIILRVCEQTWSLFGWVFPLSNRVIWYFSPYQTESRVCNSSNFLFNTHITPVKCIWNFWNDDNTNNWRKVMENFSYMLKYDTEKKGIKAGFL